jgi:hypothetical protein
MELSSSSCMIINLMGAVKEYALAAVSTISKKQKLRRVKLPHVRAI